MSRRERPSCPARSPAREVPQRRPEAQRWGLRCLLAAYDDDADLRFHDGDHQWAGTHRGKRAIGRFLRNMVDAGLQGTIRELWTGGPPWALTLVARFDDEAPGPSGSVIYNNRAVLVVRTRFGRIIEQDDFYEDTSRIESLETRLRELERPRA